MTIKKIEIQDAEGNIYHPHSTSDVIFHGNKTAKELFEQFLKFLENGGEVLGDIAVESQLEKGVKTIYQGTGRRVKRPTYNMILLNESDDVVSNIVQSKDDLSPSNEFRNLISLGRDSRAFKDIFLTGNSKSTNGYIKLPNGMFLQWGGVYASINSPAMHVTFPIAFPNMCVFTGVSTVPTVSNAVFASGYKSHNNGVFITLTSTLIESGYQDVYWFAIGY